MVETEVHNRRDLFIRVFVFIVCNRLSVDLCRFILLFIGCCCSKELVSFAKEIYVLNQTFLTGVCFEWLEILIFQITQIPWEA
jgi:hypothetical protein